VTNHGNCTVELRDAGTETERLVVTQADPNVLASVELVQEWRDGSSGITLDGNVVRFGTEGEGLGVVAYELGEVQLSSEWVSMRRVA
jgi:hypothetical protein